MKDKALHRCDATLDFDHGQGQANAIEWEARYLRPAVEHPFVWNTAVI